MPLTRNESGTLSGDFCMERRKISLGSAYVQTFGCLDALDQRPVPEGEERSKSCGSDQPAIRVGFQYSAYKVYILETNQILAMKLARTNLSLKIGSLHRGMRISSSSLMKIYPRLISFTNFITKLCLQLSGLRITLQCS
jgi:hypothetical protein